MSTTTTKIYGKITVIKRNGEIGSQLPVTSTSCTFGRESDCEIRIQLPSVSSHECQLLADENGRFVMSKLNEKGEILVNDRALAAQVTVNHNDVLTIAGRSFRFEYPPQQRTKMASGKFPVRTPRPSAVDRLRQTEKRRVSFGPQLSPEQFDLSLPPNTPVKKGAIPMRNLSNTADDIDRRGRLLTTAKRKSVEKSVPLKTTDGKKEKRGKKRSFDKLVEPVGLDNLQEKTPSHSKDKSPKTPASGQLDFFGAITKTPKSSKPDESKQNNASETNEETPVAVTPVEKRRSLPKCTVSADEKKPSDAVVTSKTQDKKMQRSTAGTPQSSKAVSPITLPDNTRKESIGAPTERHRSTKGVPDDLDDTLPVEAGIGKPTTPTQNRRSMTMCDTPAIRDVETNGIVTTPAEKKRRSNIATPQPPSGIADIPVLENVVENAGKVGAEIEATHTNRSDVTQSDKNKPNTPKQKRKSLSKTVSLAGKPKTPKTLVPVSAASESAQVPAGEASESAQVPAGIASSQRQSVPESVTPTSIKKYGSRRTSSVAITPSIVGISTPGGKRKSRPDQQVVSTNDTTSADDVDQQQEIVLIVQEQMPAKQTEAIPQTSDMILEIGVETPTAVPSGKETPRLSRRSKTPRFETSSAEPERWTDIPIIQRRRSARSVYLEQRPQTPVIQRQTPVIQRQTPVIQRQTPVIQRQRRSIVMEVTKSPRGIPSNSAILTARRKSLRRRKSGVLLWSDVVRKNANKQLETKTEPIQLQKVTKAARRSLPRTPKQARNLRHVDSPATIYICRKTRPRRSMTSASLDMGGDWTSEDDNTKVEDDSFVLSQNTVDKADEAIGFDIGHLVKTPRVKGQPVEDHFGTKRLLKTPKDKVKGQPVEEHLGTKRLLKTPKDKVRGQPVKVDYGLRRLLDMPTIKVKGQPVEEHFGTKRLLKTPQTKVKGQPVEEHFGTKRLLKTPVDKVKGEAVQKEYGTKRLFHLPRVKGRPVEYNFGLKRLLSTREIKRKNEPVEDDFCLGQIFGYEADMNEKLPSDLGKVQPLASKKAANPRTTSKTRKEKSLTTDVDDMPAVEKPVERISTRTRKSARSHSSDSESDSNAKKSTKRRKVKAATSDGDAEIALPSKKRKQSDDSDSAGSTEMKKQGGAQKKRRVQEDMNQVVVETPTRRSSRTRVQMTEKPKVSSPKTKLSMIPEVEEPSEAFSENVDAHAKKTVSFSGVEQEPVVEVSRGSNKAAASKSVPRRVGKKQGKSEALTHTGKARKSVGKIGSQATRSIKNAGKATELLVTKGLKPTSSVKRSKTSQQLSDDNSATLVSITKTEKTTKQAAKKTRSVAEKKIKPEVTQPTRTTRRGKVVPAESSNMSTTDEPVMKRPKTKTSVEVPIRRATRAAKSKPIESDSELTTTTKKRKIGDKNDTPKMKEITIARPSTRKRKTSREDTSSGKKTADAKASQSAATTSDPARKSTRVRKVK